MRSFNHSDPLVIEKIEELVTLVGWNTNQIKGQINKVKSGHDCYAAAVTKNAILCFPL